MGSILCVFDNKQDFCFLSSWCEVYIWRKKYQFKETNEELLLLNIYFNEKKVHLDEQGEEKSELTLPWCALWSRLSYPALIFFDFNSSVWPDICEYLCLFWLCAVPFWLSIKSRTDFQHCLVPNVEQNDNWLALRDKWTFFSWNCKAQNSWDNIWAGNTEQACLLVPVHTAYFSLLQFKLSMVQGPGYWMQF